MVPRLRQANAMLSGVVAYLGCCQQSPSQRQYRLTSACYAPPRRGDLVIIPTLSVSGLVLWCGCPHMGTQNCRMDMLMLSRRPKGPDLVSTCRYTSAGDIIVILFGGQHAICAPVVPTIRKQLPPCSHITAELYRCRRAEAGVRGWDKLCPGFSNVSGSA